MIKTIVHREKMMIIGLLFAELAIRIPIKIKHLSTRRSMGRLVPTACSSDHIVNCGVKLYFVDTSGKFIIASCIFVSLSSNGEGGAVKLDGTNASLRFTDSAFISCYSSRSSGAIVLTLGSFNISRICGIDCSADLTYQFAYIATKSHDTFCTEYASICQCGNSTDYGAQISFAFIGGNETFRFINSTQNCIRDKYSSMLISSASLPIDYKFLNIINSTVKSGSNCVLLTYLGELNFSHLNFIQNTQSSTIDGHIVYLLTIESRGFFIIDSIFLYNSAAPLFSSDNKSIFMVRCVIDFSEAMIGNATVIETGAANNGTANFSSFSCILVPLPSPSATASTFLNTNDTKIIIVAVSAGASIVAMGVVALVLVMKCRKRYLDDPARDAYKLQMELEDEYG